MSPTILVTGGAGFIGSHTCVALAAAGYAPLVLDNFCNSDVRVFERLARIIGSAPRFVEGDVRDRALLDRLFAEQPIAGVIHFAGLKSVGESVSDPLAYYDNNVHGSLVLAAAMEAASVHTLIFSSSATVYGATDRLPIGEGEALQPTNPYGHSKQMVEQALADLQRSDPRWRITLLRYFNPVGAHESGLIGEHPHGKPNNLMPYVSQVAVGLRDKLAVHGGDYPTPDGTGVRDYVHVMDLAEGHVAALRHAERQAGLATLNLGTGRGTSVLEVVKAFERASGRSIAYEIGPRRTGDVPSNWADPALAQATLGWRAQRGIDQMCADSWRWQQANPRGYES
ncbi:UDP-glucose 4-epimerase GalE [Variovorax saccharolyticus]|uniref:UDP-glucose 4-epimerase GalE n=1 Tax=Variovorax saccharolyticus TaxID=3053516 RepID=UPI002574A5F2|nr:UDP-glucose 4-epimerase GalE [Variovorax sp. J22R187]MDM0017572.1 UDP-glucose 4-epimerase GalE [Variovorax sp. J22R187]